MGLFGVALCTLAVGVVTIKLSAFTLCELPVFVIFAIVFGGLDYAAMRLAWKLHEEKLTRKGYRW